MLVNLNQQLLVSNMATVVRKQDQHLKIHAGLFFSVSLGKCVTIAVMLPQKYIQEYSRGWIGLRKEGWFIVCPLPQHCHS